MRRPKRQRYSETVPTGHSQLQKALRKRNDIAKKENDDALEGVRKTGKTQIITLTADEKKEFIAVTNQLKLLDDRRQQILARTGDEYVMDPPKLPAKP